MSDALIGVAIVLGLGGLMAYFKLWRLLGLLVIIGVYEAILGITGLTISQEFWKFSLTNALGATVMLVILGAMFALLLVHLAWKMYKRSRGR